LLDTHELHQSESILAVAALRNVVKHSTQTAVEGTSINTLISKTPILKSISAVALGAVGGSSRSG